MYVATTGPIPRAATAQLIQMWRTQILDLKSNIFSKLLTATVVGSALTNPQTMRPTITAGSVGEAAITTQLRVKPAAPTMYSVLPPNVSAMGGSTRPPTAWARRYVVVKDMSAISRVTPKSAAPAAAVDEPVLLIRVVNISRKKMTAASYTFLVADQFLGWRALFWRHVTFPVSSTSKPR